MERSETTQAKRSVMRKFKDIESEVTENYRIAKEVYKWLVGRDNFYIKDDLIQSAVIQLLRKRDDYDPVKSSYETWAKTIATNCMTDILRRNKKHHVCPSIFTDIGNDLLFEDILGTGENNHYYNLLIEDIGNVIEKHITNIRYKKIIDLYMKHYTHDEIAERVGISRQYVTYFVKKFRKLLDDKLGLAKGRWR